MDYEKYCRKHDFQINADTEMFWNAAQESEREACAKTCHEIQMTRFAHWIDGLGIFSTEKRDMATYEQERAIMESEQAAAEDEYFKARPQIDCIDRRRVFEAGFQRAWEIANSYFMKNGQDA